MKLEIAMQNEQGLTLVEVITAMAVLAIIISTAIPNFSAWKINYQIRSESERVHMTLLSARMTALNNNTDVVVTFLPASHTYSILDDSNSDGIADTGESLKSLALENDVQFGFNGPSITDMDNNTVTETVKMGPSDIVTFDGRGQASLSGVLFLIHEDDYPVGNDRLRGISVIQATGAAELWEYKAGLSPIPWE